MTHAEHSAGKPSLRSGCFATLSGLLRAKGSGAPSQRPARLSLAVLGIALAVLALTGAPALAVPPASFGSQGQGAGQMQRPRGIAVDQESGDVYVLDTFNSRVDKFGPEGEFLLAFGWGVATGAEELQTCGPESIPPTVTCLIGRLGNGAGQFGIEPSGIAIDNSGGPSQGDVYAIAGSPFGQQSDRVQKFNSQGHFEWMIGGIGGNGLGKIAVGPTGTVYVGEEGRVRELSPAGASEGQIPLPGIKAEQIAVDSASDVYVAGGGLSGVHKYDGAGVELGVPRDPSVHSTHTNLAVGPSDELFVDGYGSAGGGTAHFNRIDVFDPSGKQLSAFPNQVNSSKGIAFGNTINRLYVLDEVNAIVDLLSPPPPGPVPQPASTEAREIGKTAATFCAELNPEGAESTVHFQYITEAKYKTDGESFGAGSEVTAESASVGSDFVLHQACQASSVLTLATVYRFRAIATNSNAPLGVIGETASFETLPAAAIDSTFATLVSATTATLGTEINPLGDATAYHFEYDTVEYSEGGGPHGTVLPVPDGSVGSGSADVTRTVPLQGLAPATVYHYRVVTTNALGVVQGPDRAFTTQGAGGSTSQSGLPDGRGWEMVSPPEKGGILLEGIAHEGADIQAAADGSGMAYVAHGAINTEALGSRSPVDTQLLARRGPAGWSTRDVTAPNDIPHGVPVGRLSEYMLFSPDLSVAVLVPQVGKTALSPLATERTPYLLQPDGSYLPLVTAANVPPGTQFGGKEEGSSGSGEFSGDVRFAAATPDAAHVVISSPQALTEPVFPAQVGNASSLYEWSAGALTLLSQVPSGSATVCGGSGSACVPAAKKGLESFMEGGVGTGVRNAISNDGSRAVFTAHGGSTSMFLRDVGRGETVQLDSVQPGALGVGDYGEPIFQDASIDGSRVFFTDGARLTPGSTATRDARDLYMCEVGEAAGHLACALKDLTVDHNPGEHAGVKGLVTGAAADGSSVYFVANGALTEGAVHGNCSEGKPSQSCNLYRYDTSTEAIKLVAVLSGADFPDWGFDGSSSGLGMLTARVSPDGRWLAFMSQRPLSGYDNRDAVSGERDEEVFLYDAETGALHCASCNPTGARPRGVPDNGGFPGLLVDRPDVWRSGLTLAASIPGWTKVSGSTAFYQSRYLSDSGRLFFNAADALVPRDSNGTGDVYQYEPPGVGSCTQSSPTYGAASGGCVDLISAGVSGEESAFLDASESGNDVFFLTASQLAPQDLDTALDVYDAHVCSGELPCPPPPSPPAPACEGDACQSPVQAPNDPTPGSLTFSGPGNVTPGVTPSAIKKTTRKAVKCKKPKKLSHGKCVKPKKKAKRATSNRGAER